MLSVEEHTASMAGLEQLANRLISGYAARCAARARIREERSAADRKEHQPDGIFSVIPDGTLAMARKDATTFLWLEWDDEYGQRLLAQGEQAEVERFALEVAVHGPAGGPDFRGQGVDWHRRGDEDTEHSLTIGGEFRLMRSGGAHLLMFVRNDGGAHILGWGEADALKRTAHARLKSFFGDALHLYIGDARVQLRGVGAAGVLGYLEMFDGTMMLLGHLAGGNFGLFHVLGGQGQLVGLYDFKALYRGELGQVLRWTVEAARGAEAGSSANPDREDEGDDDLADREVRQVHRRRSRSCTARPRSRARPAAYKTELSSDELELIARHMTLTTAPSGKGSTIALKLLGGVGALACLGLPNQLLYGCDVLRLLKERLGIEIHCCSRTLSAALAIVAAHTNMVVSVGKRWAFRFRDLLLVDSELMRWIAERTPNARKEAAAPEASTSSTVDASPGPASSATAPEGVSDSAVGTPPATTGEPTLDVGLADHGPRDAPDDEADLQPPIQQGYRRRYKRWHQEGPLRTTLASVPDGESASRWDKKRGGRDPPW